MSSVEVCSPFEASSYKLNPAGTTEAQRQLGDAENDLGEATDEVTEGRRGVALAATAVEEEIYEMPAADKLSAVCQELKVEAGELADNTGPEISHRTPDMYLHPQAQVVAGAAAQSTPRSMQPQRRQWVQTTQQPQLPAGAYGSGQVIRILREWKQFPLHAIPAFLRAYPHTQRIFRKHLGCFLGQQGPVADGLRLHWILWSTYGSPHAFDALTKCRIFARTGPPRLTRTQEVAAAAVSPRVPISPRLASHGYAVSPGQVQRPMVVQAGQPTRYAPQPSAMKMSKAADATSYDVSERALAGSCDAPLTCRCAVKFEREAQLCRLTTKGRASKTRRQKRRGKSSGSPEKDQSVKLFVGRLPREVTESQLRDLFQQFGQPVEVFIINQQASSSFGCAFVRLANLEQAKRAIQELHDKPAGPSSGRLDILQDAGGQAPTQSLFTPLQVTFAKGELQRLQLEDDQLVMSPKGNIQLDPAETQALFLSLCQEGQLNGRKVDLQHLVSAPGSCCYLVDLIKEGQRSSTSFKAKWLSFCEWSASSGVKSTNPSKHPAVGLAKAACRRLCSLKQLPLKEREMRRRHLLCWLHGVLALRKTRDAPAAAVHQARKPNLRMNLTKNLIGAGMFSLPSGLKSGSVLPGLMAMVTVCTFCSSSFILIAFLCKQLRCESYREVFCKAFGQRFGLLIDGFIGTNCFFACVAYTILTADFLQKAAEGLLGTVPNRILLIICNTCCFMLPLSHAKDLSALRYTSMLGLAHYNAPRIFKQLGGDLKAHAQTVVASFSTALTIYSVFAVSGLGLFGDELVGNVLRNYDPDNTAIMMVWFGMAFAVIFTYPLVFTAAREALVGSQPALQEALRKQPLLAHVSITCTMVCAISFVACCVEEWATKPQ
eukprot:g15736.t1